MKTALNDQFIDISVDISSTGDLSALLKKRREDLGFSILDVSSRIKIRGEHLKFMENDLFEKLPGKVYAIGFVRTYSAYLGLNENLIVERMRLLPEYAEVSTIINVRTSTERVKNTPIGAILFAILMLFGFIYFLSISQETKESKSIRATEKVETEENKTNSLENTQEDKKEITFN
ncbi:MAG: helix-turn-helix domain-containing protein [Proteobacteria bacterium]|nr:helix-turn-helix domain-containing protein [Pseudomonadota bacterium]